MTIWKNSILLRHVVFTVVAGLVLLLLTTKIGQFRDFQLAEVAAYVCAVGGLTMLIGTSGQISIGHGAFMLIGAYAAALLLQHLHWPLELLIVAAAVIAAAAGGLMGLAAARLRGPYLAGATLMLAVALPEIATRYQGIFGGDQGLDITVNTPPQLGASFELTEWLAWFSVAVALVTLFILANLMRSRVGRNWRAVRDDEVAASLAGLNVAQLQVRAFVVSAACAGVGGALLAIVTQNVAEGGYSLTLSIGLLTAAVIGGLGSLAGAVWGSLLFVLVPNYLTNVATSHGLSGAASSSVPIAAYGLVLIIVMLAFPSGIQGAVRRLLGLAAPAATDRLTLPLRRAQPGPLSGPGPDTNNANGTHQVHGQESPRAQEKEGHHT
jgi:branched-chain amino acid transport system permease protein